MSSAAPTGQEETAALLRALLLQPGRYRDRWIHRVEKRRDGSISQAAVARVISDHLQSQPDGWDPGFRKLRARVSRALNGQSLTAETLTLFLIAFAISEDDARRLWATLSGTSPENLEATIEPLALPHTGAASFQSGRFKISTLQEIHFLDVNGKPERHNVHQDVVALVDGVDRIPVRWDTESITVTEANLAVSEIYLYKEGMYAFDIILPRPLQKGERQSITYTVHLLYKSPKHHFQRRAVQELENVSMEVHFHPDNVPTDVWWASWNSALNEAKPVTKERMLMDGGRKIVSKSLAYAANCTVGFFWAWSTGSNHD